MSAMTYGEATPNGVTDRKGNPLTELRLMHEWTAHVCDSLPNWEFWKYKAPLIAFKYRYILDALLAIAALHYSRQQPRVWISLEGRMVTQTDQNGSPPRPEETSSHSGWKVIREMAAKSNANVAHVEDPSTDPREMLLLARQYFDDALEGFQRAVAEPSAEKMQGLYECSVLVSFYSLFILSEELDTQDVTSQNPIQWFRVSRGSLHLVMQWQNFVGSSWVTQVGGLYGHPDLTDDEELFRPIHRKPFEYILSPVAGDEITDHDRQAYEDTLAYIGLIYKGIEDQSETAIAICRFVTAMPSRIPMHFSELVESSQPRAYVMLIHMFACLKLVEDRYPWFKGIAERQVPILCDSLPLPWREMIQWPLRVAKGEIHLKPPS